MLISGEFVFEVRRHHRMPHPPAGGVMVFGPQVSVKIASLLEQPEPLAEYMPKDVPVARVAAVIDPL